MTPRRARYGCSKRCAPAGSLFALDKKPSHMRQVLPGRTFDHMANRWTGTATIACIAVALLVLVAVPAYAQEATPTPVTIVGTPTVELSTGTVAAIASAMASFVASAGGTSTVTVAAIAPFDEAGMGAVAGVVGVVLGLIAYGAVADARRSL